MECHRRHAALICARRSEFFLIGNAFCASFQCERRGRWTLEPSDSFYIFNFFQLVAN